MFAGHTPIGLRGYGTTYAEKPQRPYAFPKLAGKKFRSINLVPRPTDSGNASNIPVVTPAFTYDLIYDIGKNGPTDPGWTQWLLPQMKLFQSLGANAFRFIIDPTARAGDSTHNGPAVWRGSLTAAEYAAFLQLMANGAASCGLWFYPALMEPIAAQNLTTSQILTFAAESMQVLTDPTLMKNVVCIDGMQEWPRSPWATTGSNLANLQTTMRAAMIDATIPITQSFYIAALSDVSNAVNVYPSVVYRLGCDYLDLHNYIYTDGGPWMNQWSPLNGFGLPVLIGETGILYNGTYFQGALAQENTHPYSSQLRARHWQDFIASVGQRYDIQMTQPWGTVREWNSLGQIYIDSQDWGVYDLGQDANYNFTTPRPEFVTPYLTIPTAPQSYDATWSHPLAGVATSIASYSSQQTYMLGWGMLDYSDTWYQTPTTFRRNTFTSQVGAVNYFLQAAVNQSALMAFTGQQAVPQFNQISWAVSVRHQGNVTTGFLQNHFYFANITSDSGTPANDGILRIYKVVAGVATQIASTIALQPFDLFRSYTVQLTATNHYPTTLVAQIIDTTHSVTLATLTVVDATVSLQAEGNVGYPAGVGNIQATALVMRSTNDFGPALAAPTLSAASSTSINVNWAANGGLGAIVYQPEYVALNSYGQPNAAWTSLGIQSITSTTITGLSTGTAYAVRIRAVDQSFAQVPRYSAWAQTAVGGGGELTQGLLIAGRLVGGRLAA